MVDGSTPENTPEQRAPEQAVAVPVAHARPALSTACSLLVIAAGVPFAVLLLVERLTAVLPQVVISLSPAPQQIGRAVLAAGLAACLAAPVAGWLARVWPPWVVLVAAVLAAAAGYWLATDVSTIHGLYLVRALQGAGAGGLLAGTAALVGAASAWTRPYLAAVWAAAFVGTAAIRTRLVQGTAGDAANRWQLRLEPVRWLLVATMLAILLLAVVSVADRRPRLFPRWVDLAALLPLLAGLAVGLLIWPDPPAPGTLALLLTLVLAGVLAACLAGARLAPPGSRASVGSATAAVAFASAAAVGASVTGISLIRQYTLLIRQPVLTGPVVGAGIDDLLTVTAAVGVIGAVAGALLPEHRRRRAILAGLPVAAVGATLLLPASDSVGLSVPGAVLLAAGCGVALGAVLRSVGPLATVVAGALAAVSLTAADYTRGILVGWRSPTVSGRGDIPAQFAILRDGAVAGQRWWLALLIVLLLGATAVVALALPDAGTADH